MEITISELLALQNPNLIDIRGIDAYRKNHIPGAIPIDSMSLLLHPDIYLKRDQIYYLYCNSGVRSKLLVEKLNRMGYSTVSVLGGFQNYLLRK